MTPNLRIDQHNGFRGTLREKMFDVRKRFLQNRSRPMSSEEVHRHIKKRKALRES